MYGRKKKKFPIPLLICVFVILSCAVFLSQGAEAETQMYAPRRIIPFFTLKKNELPLIVEDPGLNLTIKAVDEGETFFYSSNGYYRYGPSIIKYEDGSMDAWFSAPGNNSTQWDWITYRHSDDGENWSGEKTVLKPTAGSRDSCSVCDPGVIFFNDYYYLGYTSTDYYEGKGTNNSAFVARSKNPDGPYEKWNGEGWGGDPEPIIEYEGNPKGWGIGELSFVILENELYIYYTYFGDTGGYTSLAKADLSENWPLSIEEKGMVMGRTTQDSLDVVYADDYQVFMAFSIENRMSQGSEVAVYISDNGNHFEKADSTKRYIEDYAHNMGIAKSKEGHLSCEDELLIGYAYGKRWGRWDAKFQKMEVYNTVKYKVIEN